MARYDYGVERRLPVENLEAGEIESIVEELINEAGEIESIVEELINEAGEIESIV
eukprot:CAMPEP_0205817164 /NCGR_PEP_ID=MMETSP0205-20121125/23896_1 /ASSEMBLY_ACC=CAM_ASM_000278 /TAXON_ID=36767 /ORGANISM="Euplotes focardii, Strain TN1" /LENGTH=54 /DNA_ID=CAMNT_0053107125 /DNA_START=196 /DNA_END=356 /DNA_ORIENTATION=-